MEPWKPSQDDTIKRLYGLFPIHRIAEEIEKDPVEVLDRAWAMGIPHISQWDNLFTFAELSKYWGMDLISTTSLAEKHLGPFSIFYGIQETRAVEKSFAVAWTNKNLRLIHKKGGQVCDIN